MHAKEALTRSQAPKNVPRVLLDGTLPVRVLTAQCARLADTLGLQQRFAKIALCLIIPPLIPLIAFLAQLGAWLKVGTRIAHCAWGG